MSVEENYAKFEEWLLKIIAKEKPSKEIIAYNIGIFQTPVSFTAYLMGAKKYDVEDSDWACKPDYYPADQYFDFPKEYTKDKKSKEIETEVIDFAKKFKKRKEYKESFLGKAQALTVGFDDDELYTI